MVKAPATWISIRLWNDKTDDNLLSNWPLVSSGQTNSRTRSGGRSSFPLSDRHSTNRQVAPH